MWNDAPQSSAPQGRGPSTKIASRSVVGVSRVAAFAATSTSLWTSARRALTMQASSAAATTTTQKQRSDDRQSLRALMDACVGAGQWRYAPPIAQTLEELPLVDATTSPTLATTLEARGIAAPAFLQWYNAHTRATWAECATYLHSLPAGHVPPFVLQRALHKIDRMADAASAVRVVSQHIPSYNVEEATRLCLLLWALCIRRWQAWHMARPIAEMTMHCATRWLHVRTPQPAKAQRLLQTAGVSLVRGARDERVRHAFLQVYAMACEHVPSAAKTIEQYILKHMPTQASSAWLDVAAWQTMLAARPTKPRAALLRVGIRLAASERRMEQARAWYDELGAPQTPSTSSTAFLRALSHIAPDTDLREAWALFDQISAGHDGKGDGEHAQAKLNDWILMLRAAAIDERIPVQRTMALLGLYETDEPLHVGWHAPASIQAQLATSVVAHTALVDGLIARHELARAWAVWEAMLRRGIVPDVWALTSLCRIYLHAGEPVRALECVLQYCREGVALIPNAGVHDVRVPPSKDALGAWPIPTSTTETAPRVRVVPSPHLANTLLAGLVRLGAYETVMHLWQALGPTLHVVPDVISLDLMLRAATAQTYAQQTETTYPPPTSSSRLWPYAARAYFRRTLQTQHPDLQQCQNPLETSGARGWFLRGELQWRRWERWWEDRVTGLWGGGPSAVNAWNDAGEASSSPAPPALCLDARVFHQYAELLLALIETAPGLGATASWAQAMTEELFMVAAWMRALDLTPQTSTLCLLCSAQDELLPPMSGAMPLRTYLSTWLGAEHVPSDDAIGAWFRQHHRRRWPRDDNKDDDDDDDDDHDVARSVT